MSNVTAYATQEHEFHGITKSGSDCVWREDDGVVLADENLKVFRSNERNNLDQANDGCFGEEHFETAAD